MKNIIKLMGILLGKLFNISNSSKFINEDSKKLDILRKYDEIIYEYSNSGQKDFLRIAVIKSLKFCLPEIFTIIKSENFNLLLSYSRTFVRLLQDEIPEIRQKLANFLSKMLNNSQKTATLNYNFNYVLEEYLVLIENLYISQENINQNEEAGLELMNFLSEMIFESEFFKCKKTNYFDKRIFSFDKPNKFHDDFTLKRFAFDHFKRIAEFLITKKDKTDLLGKIIVNLETGVKQKKYSFLVRFLFVLYHFYYFI